MSSRSPSPVHTVAIQPEGQIGPNNAGKMALRSMLMVVSEKWLVENPAITQPLLDYLNNRCGEVGGIRMSTGALDYGPVTEHELNFFTQTIADLKKMEANPASELDNPAKVQEQAKLMVARVRYRLLEYKHDCARAGIQSNPDLIANAKVITENILTRKGTPYLDTQEWEVKPVPVFSEALEEVKRGEGPPQVISKGIKIGSEDSRDPDQDQEQGPDQGDDDHEPYDGYSPIK